MCRRNTACPSWKSTASAAPPPYPQRPETHSLMNIKDKVFDVGTARLQVGGFDEKVPVSGNGQEIVFEVDLKPGAQRIETWCTMADGSRKAACYIHINPVVN